jgi:hypothetical protein
VTVALTDDTLTIQDNGPGLPLPTLTRSLDYAIRVPDKVHYVSPSRGQLGNALKCLWAAACVAHGTGLIEIMTGGTLHQVKVSVDRIAQRPRLEHTLHPDGLVKTGTNITLHWPGIASSLRGEGSDDSA